MTDTMARKRLGELLVMSGAIDELQLQSALGEQRKWGRPLGITMVEMDLLDEQTVVRVLGQQLSIPAVDLSAIEPDRDALPLLDFEFCRDNACIPLRHEPQGSFLDVAMADPTNPELFDRIRVRTRCNPRPRLAGPRAIDQAVRRHYLGRDAQPTAPYADNRPWMSRPDEVVFEDDTGGISARATTDDAEPRTAQDLRALREEIAALRALLDRDEKVLRKLMGLMVEKGLCTRQELIAKIHGE